MKKLLITLLVSLLVAPAQAVAAGSSSGAKTGKNNTNFALQRIIEGKQIICMVAIQNKKNADKAAYLSADVAVRVAFTSWLPVINANTGKKIEKVNVNMDPSPDVGADINVYFYPLATVQKKCDGMAGCYKKREHNIYVPHLDLNTVTENGKKIAVQDILNREVGHFLGLAENSDVKKNQATPKNGKKQSTEGVKRTNTRVPDNVSRAKRAFKSSAA